VASRPCYWAASRVFAIVATPGTTPLEKSKMTFKSLLNDWASAKNPTRTSKTYNVHLSVDDAARVHALADLFPGIGHERIITDLLSAAVEQLEAAIPYVPGDNVIREDEFGDPVYEDTGLTPQFLTLVKKRRKQLED
jgi:hypothetical protein